MSVQDIPKHPSLNVVGVHDGFHLVSGECKEVGENDESLMQERVGDTKVTVDEHASNTTEEVLSDTMLDPSYPVNLVPSHGPDLVSPQHLHFVYIQPTPNGVNIIPVKAAGRPTFTP